MEARTRPLGLVKLALLAFGIGTALLVAPACKAQSEISPDHFDGTDSWAVTAQKVHAPAQKLSVANAPLAVKRQKTTQTPAFQLVAAREVSKATSFDAMAVERKRTAAVRKPEKQ